MRRSAGMVLPALMLSLAGCGGTPTPAAPQASQPFDAQSVTSSPTPAGPSQDALDSFFNALASDDAGRIKAALKTAAPNSEAYAYANYLYLRALVAAQAGEEPDPQSVSQGDGSWKACPKTKEGGACITWADVTASGDQIASYTLNGKRINDRMTMGSGKWYSAGDVAKVQLLMTYKSIQSNSTFAVFALKNGPAKSFITTDTAYQDPSGTQINTGGSEGPSTFLPGAKAYVSVQFSNAPLGGKIYLEMVAMDGDSSGTAVIPTR